MENRRYTPKHSQKTSPIRKSQEPARRAPSAAAPSRRPATPTSGRTQPQQRRTSGTTGGTSTQWRTTDRTAGTSTQWRTTDRPAGTSTQWQTTDRARQQTAPRKQPTTARSGAASTQRKQTAQSSTQPPRRVNPERDKPTPKKKDSQKSKEARKTGCALASLYFICILGISVCLSLVVIFSANDVLALVKPDVEIEVVIPEDTTINGVSKQLDDSGIVNYGMLFRLFNAVKGDSETIVSAGNYVLNPTMDYSQILRALTKTTSTTSIKVTIPEGYTTAQIRQALLEGHVTSQALLDNALNTYPFKHSFLKDRKPPKSNWLEGYLFPDTYEFIQDSKQPVHEVINVMLNNFDKKYDAQIKEGAEKLGLTTHEVVTIASLIEREAKESTEFAKISGVIHNRLKNKEQFPNLQIDAALQYAVGHNNRLTDADKQLDSPYNLYRHEGLPPGPICNPGYNALYAATHPEEHGYYYYVAMPDGTHLFAKSNSQHNKNRAKADKAWAQQKN